MKLGIRTFMLAIAIAFGLAGGNAQAMQASDPSAVVTQLVHQAISIIQDKQQSDEARETKFHDLLQSGFDVPKISQFVLGRFWRSATDAQRQQFISLFQDWIVGVDAARFNDYRGQTIQVIGTRQESAATTVVQSQFVGQSGAPPVKVEWYVRKAGDNDYKIVDVSVEGVSMAATQRDEIAAVADRNGGSIDGLNQALKQRIQAAPAAPAGR